MLNNSVNGTFLQTRKFLSYHPKDRFCDSSFMIEDKERIVAVCPACVKEFNGNKDLFSHNGSSYGGLICHPEIYKTEKLLEIISVVESYWRERGVKKLLYKITPDILSRRPSDLLNFCLKHKGYMERQELNFYINFEDYIEDICKNFNKCRKRNISNGMKVGMYEKTISEIADLHTFYELLCKTLKKYNVVPVHSFHELLLLQNMFQKEISFIGIYLGDQMIAGTMVFYFEQTQCLHTQYLAADPVLEKISPMSFLYYAVIKYAKNRGCRYLSWGIATDHEGNLNMGLIQAKEAVGSRQAINRIFEKEL